MKEARLLGSLFIFRELEKSLKRTRKGFLFMGPNESKKEIKLCSSYYSHVYGEHKNIQRVSSYFWLHVLLILKQRKKLCSRRPFFNELETMTLLGVSIS